MLNPYELRIGNWIETAADVTEVFGIVPLQYLHQLQNLYLTIMGAELEVNLCSGIENK
jgi:hypothetical protein